jgi:hypothetical protein
MLNTIWKLTGQDEAMVEELLPKLFTFDQNTERTSLLSCGYLNQS